MRCDLWHLTALFILVRTTLSERRKKAPTWWGLVAFQAHRGGWVILHFPSLFSMLVSPSTPKDRQELIITWCEVSLQTSRCGCHSPAQDGQWRWCFWWGRFPWGERCKCKNNGFLLCSLLLHQTGDMWSLDLSNCWLIILVSVEERYVTPPSGSNMENLLWPPSFIYNCFKLFLSSCDPDGFLMLSTGFVHLSWTEARGIWPLPS